MFREFWQRWLGAPVPQGYRPYTTRFDLEVPADQLAQILSHEGDEAFRAFATEFDRALPRWRAATEIAAIESLRPLRLRAGAERLGDTVAALLVDHSGSMRGQRAMIAVALVEMIADCWTRLGIKFEILGFTTRAWQGGLSRDAWKLASRPRNPGRLCDLLHIVYRSADDTRPGAPWAIRNLLRRELLKENVDGEAIEWASRRLRSRPEAHKVLLVLSDGAPVDDSTLRENGNDYLVNHLRAVISSIQQVSDIRLAAIGLDYEVSGFYPMSISVRSPDEFPDKLVPFLAALAGGTPDDPSGTLEATA